MGKGTVTPIYTYKGPLTTDAGSATVYAPYQVSVTGSQATVDTFSYLLQDFDIKNNVFILGLGLAFTLTYGEKIYLQTVFDTNGQVAYARIDHQAFWPIYQAPTTTGGKQVQIYPAEIANLTNNDLSQYKTFLQNELTAVTAMQTAHLAALNAQIVKDQQAQNTEQVQQDQNVLKLTTTAYTNALTKLQSMQNSQSQFFGSLPSGGIVRKQVATFNVIAYTTQDDSTELNATIVTPSADDVTDGVTSYSLVQCVSTDLMLTDVFFQYTACRFPMPWSRAVYYFLDPDNSGNSEDDENTKPSGS